MSKRIAILTINDPNNYGNRLQNYALTECLKTYGEVSTIDCGWPTDSKIKQFFVPLRSFLDILKKKINSCKHSVLSSDKKKSCRFRSFNNKYGLNIACKVSRAGQIRPFLKFDSIVLGSDQVWNYYWISKSGLRLRLGSFSSNYIPTISYAASFGVSHVTDDVKPIFQQYLPRLKAISVREDRGIELVKEMTGLKATVVLDPTLMLTSDKWMNVTENFVSENDSYVLTYFLGNLTDNQEHDIQMYAAEHGCRVRRMLDLRDRETYVAGPQDFVELFARAQYVFTDSYHACCFSILFHKQFTVFNRAGMTGKASMNSRMETLFRLFDLDSVMIDSGLAPEIDYAKVDRLLEQHRKESRDWLDKAMEE
ncbi:polysaccharide pyruvyl transferase family protein [Bifidobacterium adolescentis]|uniref:polysaccharide pyruvyl transferase family protein n=1 Tax=Bifidobacterium adolescentis TaxID=1680 RepID=UPI0040644527